jgi:hypothetical protein
MCTIYDRSVESIHHYRLLLSLKSCHDLHDLCCESVARQDQSPIYSLFCYDFLRDAQCTSCLFISQVSIYTSPKSFLVALNYAHKSSRSSLPSLSSTPFAFKFQTTSSSIAMSIAILFPFNHSKIPIKRSVPIMMAR